MLRARVTTSPPRVDWRSRGAEFRSQIWPKIGVSLAASRITAMVPAVSARRGCTYRDVAETANIFDREMASRSQAGHLRFDVSCEDASNLQIADVAEADVFPDRRNLRLLLPDFDVMSAVDHCLLPDGDRLVTE
jgi:hypothetical protein